MIEFHKKHDPREYVEIREKDFEPVFHNCRYIAARINKDKGFSGSLKFNVKDKVKGKPHFS